MTPQMAEEPAQEGSIRYRGWRVVAASSVSVSVSFASLLVYTFGVFLKPLIAQFGWSRESASAAFGFAAMAVAACSPFIGILLDRYPARRIMMPCFAVFGCAFMSLSLMTNSLWHLYVVFLVLGIVGNGTAQLASSRAVATWFHEKRGLAFAFLVTGGAIGAMVWPPFTEMLIRMGGWRSAFVVLGALSLGVGMAMAWRIRERPRTALVSQETTPISGATVKEGLRSRAFWIVVVVLFCVSIGQNGAITQLSALLTDRGVSAGGAALAASSLGGAALAGRLITGWLLDRLFAPRVGFLLLMISALGPFILATAHSTAMGMTAAVLIGFGMGGEGDVTPYLLAKYFGIRSFSTLYAMTWTAYAIAGAIGPVIMGKAFDVTGSYEGLLIRLAMLTAAVGALMLLLPRYPAREVR
jgi:MFS family permease